MTIEQFNSLEPVVQEAIRADYKLLLETISLDVSFDAWLDEQSVFEYTETHLLIRAFKHDSLPVNPRPFLKALNQGVLKYGTDWIRSDGAKALLWVIMAQSHDQLANIDMVAEWQRLNKIF